MKSKSIIDNNKRCFICGNEGWLERHHIFGASNRNNSEKTGCWVWLCHWCHNEPPNGAHFNRGTDRYLKTIAQKEYEKLHSHDEFMDMFGRNYLEE